MVILFKVNKCTVFNVIHYQPITSC